LRVCDLGVEKVRFNGLRQGCSTSPRLSVGKDTVSFMLLAVCPSALLEFTTLTLCHLRTLVVQAVSTGSDG